MKKRTLLRSFAAMPLAFPLMSSARETPASGDHFTAASRIADVEADPAFKGFGRLLFPLESRYWSGTTLGDISLDWYSEIRVANTVAVFNFLKREAESGIPVFTPLYAADEVRADPEKADAGLVFFKGRPGAFFAVIYRPDPYKACEDLSRALAVIFENAAELKRRPGIIRSGAAPRAPAWRPGSGVMGRSASEKSRFRGLLPS